MSATVQTETGNAAAKMLDRAVCLKVSFSQIGTKKKAKALKIDAELPLSPQMLPGTVYTDATASRVRVTKQTLAGPEIKAISSAINDLKRFISDRALPSIFKGVFFIPVDLITEIDDACKEFENVTFPPLVEALLSKWDEYIAQSEIELGSLFNPADYDSASTARKKFGFQYQFITFSAPGQLKGIKRALFEKEQAKLAATFEDAAKKCQQALRAGFLELVQHMAESLKPSEDGKKKRFYSSTLDNMTRFLDFFAKRNIVDDRELANVVETARDILAGVSADDIKESDDMRAVFSDAFSEIQGQLSLLVTTTGSRLVSFDDEEENNE